MRVWDPCIGGWVSKKVRAPRPGRGSLRPPAGPFQCRRGDAIRPLLGLEQPSMLFFKGEGSAVTASATFPPRVDILFKA